MTKELTTVSPEAQAIAVAVEAGDISALKDMSAMASGLQKAAKARGLGIENENKAAEVVLRAERGIGQVLIGIKERGGLVTGKLGARTDDPAPSTKRSRRREPLRDPEQFPTLDSLGIKPNQSSAWQQLARLPDDVFEGLLASKRDSVERIAKVDFYRLAEPAREYTPPGYAPGQQVPPTTPLDPAYAALREATRLAFGYVPDGTGGGEYTDNAMKRMHHDDLVEVAGFIQQWAAGYGEARKYLALTQQEREAVDRGERAL